MPYSFRCEIDCHFLAAIMPLSGFSAAFINIFDTNCCHSHRLTTIQGLQQQSCWIHRTVSLCSL